MAKPATIQKILGREILDSRGNPTVEVCVSLSDGTAAVAAVPSGASTGTFEAHELRDGDKRRYNGKGVLRAVRNVNGPIAKALAGMAASDQPKVDQRLVELDGTPQKTHLGANAIVGVSLAVARAAALSAGLPLYKYLRQTLFSDIRGWRLPTPMCNVLNGGAHANWNVDIQEYLVLPQQKSAVENVRCAAQIFHALGQILSEQGFPTTVGDEGGYAPELSGNVAALEAMVSAVRRAAYRIGADVQFGLDVAASGFFRDGKYQLRADKKTYSAEQLIALYQDWASRYPLATIEDGLAEDAWEDWKKLTATLGQTVTLIGDDLFVTNAHRLQQGIQQRVANAIVIKPNQIGTLTETVATMIAARNHKYATVVSHRSGETTDDFIVDLAVAGGAEYLKAGSMSRGERLAKWNRLMKIAEEAEK